jgi:glycine oxidase
MSINHQRRSAYDLVVVGAGVIGLASAWRAARAGLSVLVLERDQPGAGASGVAAGMLAPVTEADFGEQELLALNLEGRAMWGAFASALQERTGLPSGYADSGCLVVAADRDDVAELRRLHDFHHTLGLDSEWLTPRAARALEPGLSPRIGGAISAPHDGHVDPRAVVAALAAALEADGGELRAGCAVEGLLEDDGGRVSGVRTTGGERIAAEAVLVAAGAWSAGLAPDAPRVRPVKGQLLELRVREGRPAPAARLVRTPRCYVVSRPDGRVVVGATTEEQGFDTSVTADGVFRLLEAALEVLPDVAELDHGPRPQRRAAGTPDRRARARRARGGRGRRGALMPTVVLNGDARDLPAGATVADAVRSTGAPGDGRGVAVALDGEVVPRASWTTHELTEGERVEVLHAVQGG